MTLQQIDTRLVLYKEYLRYVLNFKCDLLNDLSPSKVLQVFKDTGLLFVCRHDSPITPTFDQWLYLNKHEDLILEYTLPTRPKPQRKINQFHIDYTTSLFKNLQLFTEKYLQQIT